MFKNKWLLWLAAIALLSGMAAAPPRQDETPSPTLELPSETPTEAAATATPTATATFEIAPVTTEGAPAIPFIATWISPTPDETGAIVVIVQPNDSMWAIAARAGISLPELLALNGLTEQSIISPGDALIVGYVTPEILPSPEELTPTMTLPPPTPRPTDPPQLATICLSAFEDPNSNGVQDAGEPLRAGVAFTVYNSEAVVINYITDGRTEPKCLGGLAPGEYRVTRSVLSNEVLTTPGDWSLSLTAGSELRQAFGSTSGPAQPPAAPPAAGATTADALASPTPPAIADAGAPTGAEASAPPRSGLLPRLAAVFGLFFGGLLLLGAVLILLLRQSSQPSASPPNDAPGGERRFQKIDDPE